MRIETRPATLDDVEALLWVRVPDSPALAADLRHDALEQVRSEIENSITYVIRADGNVAGRLRIVRTNDLLEIAAIRGITACATNGRYRTNWICRRQQPHPGE